MKILKTDLDGVLIIEPDVYPDKRGYFLEIYHKNRYFEKGLKRVFIQDNLSSSSRHTLRGLHYQCPQDQAKLIQVISGEIYDVALDIRYGSPNFGKWTGIRLSDKNKRQVFIPEGFAHGFCVLSETAVCLYKCSNLYAPECEHGVLWSDPDLSIDWQVKDPIISEKDSNYKILNDIRPEDLPTFWGGR